MEMRSLLGLLFQLTLCGNKNVKNKTKPKTYKNVCVCRSPSSPSCNGPRSQSSSPAIEDEVAEADNDEEANNANDDDDDDDGDDDDTSDTVSELPSSMLNRLRWIHASSRLSSSTVRFYLCPRMRPVAIVKKRKNINFHASNWLFVQTTHVDIAP